MARCLVVLAPGAEEIETLAPADILVRAGQQVTIASLSGDLVVPGSRGLPLAAHTTVAAVAAEPWDLVYLPGGTRSAEAMRSDARIQDLLAARLGRQQLTAIICASVTALLPRRLGIERTVTSYPGVRAQLEGHVRAWQDLPVVEDGMLVTSQGAGTAIALGLALAARLASPRVAEEVAAAMLVPVAAPAHP